MREHKDVTKKNSESKRKKTMRKYWKRKKRHGQRK